MHAVPYLTCFMGFWLIGPLVIYLWQKDRSRTVAFQAAQAMVLSVLLGVGGFIAFIAYYALIVALSFAGQPDRAVVWTMAGSLQIVVFLASFLVPLATIALGAWQAYHDPTYRMFLAGWIARRFVGDPRSP
jgi:uncharacterized Tic20 family protein